MVLFSKNAATKAALLAHRAFSTTKSNKFTYLIKNLDIPSKKVPTPDHLGSKALILLILFSI
jgi:hypothetical protein